MALQPSGPISFSQIANEFGLPPGKNLGAYRISSPPVGSLSSGLPLDDGIPQSGPIGFSSFYSKRLNVVVDLYSIPENSTRLIIKNRYEEEDAVTIIGGFKQPTDLPPDGDGKRIIANVNKTIGSAKGNRNYCALRTGSWGTDVDLEIVVGPDGKLYGAGGDGGNGAGYGSPQYFPSNAQSNTFQNISSGGPGGQGTSALGIQYPTTIINQGTIRAGRGGGGGGGSGYGVDFHDISDCTGRRNSPIIGGGGGAGGSGLPSGSGGLRSTYLSRLSNKQGGATVYAENGTSGSLTTNGQGGARGSATPQNYSQCGTRIAYSGRGGDAESSGNSGNISRTGPGDAGQRGYGIIIDSTGSIVSYIGNSEDGARVDGTVL